MRRTARSAIALAAGALLLSGCSSASNPFGGAQAPIRQSVDTSGFVPSADNPDPSKKIKGITIQKYAAAQHVSREVRVAYTHTPPIGGRHENVWAACNGVVYSTPVRSENLVHSIEHGAVWIAYDPARIQGGDVAALAALVEGKPYTVMSPFPDMPSPISLQSWGHQLAVDSVGDPRIDQFIAALRSNPNTYPEPGASCDVPTKFFDQDKPPPYVAPPAKGEVNGTSVVKEAN